MQSEITYSAVKVRKTVGIHKVGIESTIQIEIHDAHTRTRRFTVRVEFRVHTFHILLGELNLKSRKDDQ